MKYLCVCDGGNVRSVALAFILKYELGQEAVAVGRLSLSEESLEYFYTWADIIVIVQPHMEESVPGRFKEKLRCWDIGEDRYGVYVHPELLPNARAGAQWLVGGCVVVVGGTISEGP